MTSRPPPEDLIKPDIHSSSEEYRRRFAGVSGQWFLDTQDKITNSLLSNLDEEGTVIDFGGGHGQNVMVCQSLELDYAVLGSNESCFAHIKKHYNSVTYHIGLLTQSKLAPKSFTAALSYRMIPHLADWQEHISELCRVAEKSVIVEFPNRRSINVFAEKFFGLKKSVEGNTRPFALFTVSDITAEFESNDFQLSKVKGQYLLPMALHRALKNRTLSKMLESFAGLFLARDKYGSPLICKYNRLDINRSINEQS